MVPSKAFTCMAASRQDGLMPAISMESLTPKTERDSI